MIDVSLHSGRERSALRRHPWLLSGAIAGTSGEAEPGELVRVLAADGTVLGHAHWSPQGSLRLRMIGFGREAPAPDWLETRLAAACAARARQPLLSACDGLRLVNSEGDALPGLVLDRYGDVVVLRIGSSGMARLRERIEDFCQRLPGVRALVERSDITATRREGLPHCDGLRWGALPAQGVWIGENGRRYRADLLAGQKTGFYLDQRDARDLVQQIAGGRSVLDLFCYSGGFSVAAALGGARAITAVDSSAPALELAAQNLSANAPDVEFRGIEADAFAFLREVDAQHDLLVLDPPPLARQQRDVGRAARAYKDLVLHALRRAKPGAQLLVFACSHHVGADLLRKIAFGASLDAKRPLRVLRRLGAPVDHPVALDHPEGEYLNGLWLEA